MGRAKGGSKSRVGTSNKVAVPELTKEELSALSDAQALYMRFAPLNKIVQITGLPAPLITRAIYAENGWKAQRDIIQKEVNEAVKENLLKQLKAVTKLNLDLIAAGLKGFRDSCLRYQQAPTLDEADLLSRIFERLNRAKMTEEDIGDAARHAEGLDPAAIVKAFADDPYLKHAIGSDGAAALPAPEDEPDQFDMPEARDYEQERFDSNIQRGVKGSPLC